MSSEQPLQTQAPTSTPAQHTAPRPVRHHSRRRFLLGAGGLLGLTAIGGSAWALDRFVIDHVEVTDTTAYEAQNSSATTARQAQAAASQAATTSPEQITLTDTQYTSPTSSITLETVTTGSGSDTVTYYAADLQLGDATSLRSAFANDQFGQSITELPSSMATRTNAVLAFNGDYYGFRDTGILIRNGTIYRDSPARDGLAFYTDGHAEVYDETTTSAQALLDAGVWNTLSFGPALVKDGAVLSGIDQVEIDTNFGNHSIQGRQPRTAIGWTGTANEYVLVVVDGRDEGYSRGATLPELAQIMVDLGCQCAYNLDGGGSSAMYFNGQIINEPSNGGERETSDILYIPTGA